MGTKQRTTYTEALESIHECLEELAKRDGTQPAKVIALLVQRLDMMDKRQEEMLSLLRGVNGNVREHGKVLAQHKQWIEDHDAHVHPALEKRVESVATKTNAFAWIDTALSLLAGLLAGLKLR